jgi:hypothetical protein
MQVDFRGRAVDDSLRWETHAAGRGIIPMLVRHGRRALFFVKSERSRMRLPGRRKPESAGHADHDMLGVIQSKLESGAKAEWGQVA